MAQVEVYEVLRLCEVLADSAPFACCLGFRLHTVRDEASEIPAYDAMPCCSCSRVELCSALILLPITLASPSSYLFLDVLCDVLLYSAQSLLSLEFHRGRYTFSIVNFSIASNATSMACCCISSVFGGGEYYRRGMVGRSSLPYLQI